MGEVCVWIQRWGAEERKTEYRKEIQVREYKNAIENCLSGPNTTEDGL